MRDLTVFAVVVFDFALMRVSGPPTISTNGVGGCCRGQSISHRRCFSASMPRSHRLMFSLLFACATFVVCSLLVCSIRRHGRERLSVKQKACMDSVSIVKEETCYKLEEIESYLRDFRDIIQSIEVDYANAVAASEQKTKTNKGHTTHTTSEETQKHQRSRTKRCRTRTAAMWMGAHVYTLCVCPPLSTLLFAAKSYDRAERGGAGASSSSGDALYSSQQEQSHNSSQINRSALS